MSETMDQPRDSLGRFIKVDTSGRGIPDIQRPSVSPTDTIGDGGTVFIGGFIQELDKDADLRGREKYKTFSDLLANITVVATGVRYFLNLVAKAKWKVEPPEDSGEKGEELAATVREMLDDMETSWHRIVRRAAMYRFYGFSIQEWTAKRREDGLIGMLDIESRPQITIERWDTDEHGRVLGALQRIPQTMHEEYLPVEKLVYLVDDSLTTSPEGLGLFRHIVDAGRRLRRLLQLEGFGYEGDLKGIPIARAPLTDLDNMVKTGKISKAKAQSLITSLETFVKNHIKNPELGALLDSKTYVTTDERKTPSNTRQWDVELLDGGTYSLAEVAVAIIRLNLEIARLFGIEHLLMGDGKAGSHALSRDKSRNFALIVDSVLKEMSEQFEKDILGPLWDLNGWDPDLKPSLKTESTADQDPEQISSALRDLATAGIVLDRQDEAVQEIMDLVGLSRFLPLAEIDPDMQLTNPNFGGKPEDADTEPGAPAAGAEEEMPEGTEQE